MFTINGTCRFQVLEKKNDAKLLALYILSSVLTLSIS